MFIFKSSKSKKDVAKFVSKQALGIVVGYGVKEIVKAIVDGNVQPSDKLLRRVALYAGKMAIVVMIDKAVRSNTDAFVDELFKHGEKAIASISELDQEVS